MSTWAGMLLLTAAIQAQFSNCSSNCHVVGGNVVNGGAGPFLAGHVYLVNSSLVVPGGQTLTIQGGAVVKFAGVLDFTIGGTLNVTGTAGQPAILTSIADDIVADHNGNGNATLPAPGDWIGLTFNGGSIASQVTGLSVRNAGWNGNPAIRFNAASPALSQCSVVACQAAAMNLSSNSSPTVTGCTFTGGSRVAVNVPWAAVAGFSSNTASGQSVYDAIEVDTTLASGTVSIQKSNTINQSGAIVCSGNATVAGSATLTLGPGVVTKIAVVASFNVFGTLITNGTLAQPTVITSIDDDTFGGDTNRNAGASAPAAGQFVQLYLGSAASSSQLNSLLVRCAGWNGNAAVKFDQCNATASGLRTQLSGGPCVDLSNNSTPTMTGCAFDGGTVASTNIPFGALAGFTGCTASGNASYDAPIVTSPTLATGQSAVVSSTNGFNGNGVIVIPTTLSVQAGATLTLNAGVRFKVTGVSGIYVAGRLLTNGATNNPVVFTSIADDTYGGDTNKNGANSVAQPGQWVELSIGNSADLSVMQGLLVRCAGWNGNPSVRFDQSTASATGLRTQLSGGPCVDLSNNSRPTLTNCAFDGGTVAATNVRFADLSAFTGCSATGNASYDAPLITTPSTAAGESSTVLASYGFNNTGVFVIPTTLSVVANSSLTLGPGVRFKVTGVTGIYVTGTLVTNGTDGDPVTLTSITDDTIGGDTNKDGAASTGQPGQWVELNFGAGSSASIVTGLSIRCSGWNGNPSIRCSQANPTFTKVRTALSAGPCIDLSNNSVPLARFCRFDGGTLAATNVPFTSFAGFKQCTATGNSQANAPRVTNPTVASGSTAVVRAINTFNGSGAIHVPGTMTVAAGGTLDLGPGVVIKIENVASVNLYGTALWRGTGHDPVVFTSVNDDTWGGDSNVNGPSVGTNGQWVQLYVDPSATGELKHVRLACGGWNGNPAVVARSANVTFDADRVERSGGNGFQIESCAGSTLDNMVAWNCVGTGIRVDGAKTLRHATAASCGTGISSNGSGTGPGLAINSIAANNSTNFAGFAANAVTYSNGFGSGTGNVSGSPAFVNVAAGDLNLTSASPCVDTADVATAFALVFDHDEGSRLSDGRLIGSPLPDMGAYELAAYHLDVSGHAWSFETMTATVVGPPGSAALAIGPGGTAVPYVPYGFLVLGPLNTLTVIGIIPTNTPFVYTLPDESANVGTTFSFQALGVPATSATLGAFTNVYRGVLDG